MKLFRLLLSLATALLLLPAAHAQKIIEKKAPIGQQQQQVVLELPQATSIRIRGGSGQELRVRTTVNINQNKLNDALQLSLRTEGDQVVLRSAFDEALLRTSEPGDCAGNDGRQTWNAGEGKDGKGYRVCSRVEVEIEVPAGVSLRVKTISGNIEATGLTGPLNAQSISGFVDVTWPATRGAEVAFKTITGEVYTDQDIAFTNRKPGVPMVGYEVRGSLGKAGPVVNLGSISNHVYFRKQK